MALPISWLGITFGVILMSWEVNSQPLLTPPSDPGAPLIAPQGARSSTEVAPHERPASQQVPLDVISKVQTCQKNSKLLAEQTLRLAAELKQQGQTASARLSQDVAETEAKQRECMADSELNDRTTVALNEKLKVLVTQLAAAQDEIGKLTARLAENGIAPTPGFSYFDDDRSSSFMNLADVTIKVETSDRVDAADCAAAIGWTETRDGPDKPLRRQVWVWGDGSPTLCSLDRAGVVMLVPPRSTDEAHVLIFR